MARWSPVVSLLSDASGAAKAGRAGEVVVIVDIISMSTSAEAVLISGAKAIYGAAGHHHRSRIYQPQPEKIGRLAGEQAKLHGWDIIIVTEPRLGTYQDWLANAQEVISGMEQAGKKPVLILPNIGSELVTLTDFKNKVVILVTDSGGTAFEAAFLSGAKKVLTATTARVLGQKIDLTAKASAILAQAENLEADISIVAASANSLEDVLGANYLWQRIIEMKK